ncbi:hypothetical protein AWB79_01893 [Caballeronia hypogeia]|uniref:Uncharacterized protein n=2 Tax=Caballeronia hypogeia TaxID=1777140 RepID=A0A158A404_9BURK|nr:hypothetical protein AWB79_01893 [Caballeronia hypogeia]
MQATIISHEKPADPSSVEVHRFKFRIDDEQSGTMTESISLRTARVLVDHFQDGNAFIRMLKAIVAAHFDEYDDLLGRVYIDHRGKPA